MLPLVALTASSASAADAKSAAENVEKAHAEIWRRFIDPYHLMLDSTTLDGKYERPTPEECREGKPNALAWWTPIENGAMFNGSYLEAACKRWMHSRDEADREKASKLSQGLLLLASVSDTPGFIGRGVATDGKTPYPMGSNDQTSPWFYGLWRYLDSGIPEGAERKMIIDKMAQVANALAASGWKMPCNPPAPSPFRGTYAPFTWEAAPRLLFLCKVMNHLTGDPEWAKQYQTLAQEVGGDPALSRLQICEAGMHFHGKSRESWTGASGVSVLRGLWELEKDPAMKDAYARGLRASAELAAGGVVLHEKYNVDAPQKFFDDWRALNEWWRPQHSEQEAVDVAIVQVKELGKRSPQRYQEHTYVREPAFAAWIVTLCPDKAFVESQRDGILAMLSHYRFNELYYSQFFPVEMAWYRLRDLEPVGPK
ncbi:MAG: hypothetical protein ACAI34_00040 [Verrucomicrobium sp.]